MNTYSLPTFNLDLSDLLGAHSKISNFNPLPLFEKAQKSLEQKFENKTIGFYHWPEVISADEINKIQTLTRELRNQYEGLIIFGIGGSHLGAASILEALRNEKEEKNFPIFWLNNVDRWAMERAQSFVTQRKVATLLISKSGNTTETLSGFFHLSPHLDPKGIVIITDPESGELRRWINTHGYNHLPVPPNIGGRFSVLTSVGLLPLALGGVNISDLLQGAKDLKKSLAPLPLQKNPAYQYALSSYWWDKEEGHHTQYLMPYHSNLKLLTDWYVQLWAESIGKKDLQGKSVGPTFVGSLGTRDQHSLLQLFKEGPNNKVVGFIDVASHAQPLIVGASPVPSPDFDYLCQHSFEEINSKALLATAQSLKTAGVPL